jgi:uncharacterized protein (DUF2249 family)
LLEGLISIKESPSACSYTRSDMQEKIVSLDVREDIRRGREPFSRIMQTVAQLRDDEALLLTAPFEPKPLFAVLAQQGFSHNSKPLASGDWEVLFSRAPQMATPHHATGSCEAQRRRGSVVEVDARGLEPPQPMVKILEALSDLPEGAELRARTDRRPMHLYPQLEARGFSGKSEEQPDGSFVTCIRRC